jgi:hypothetical protein
MSKIEISSGVETIITPCLHYRFLWMGDHWKQEIVSVGGCQAIPKIWSIEGLISHDAPLRSASPAYQRIVIVQDHPGLTVARLDGRSGPHHYSGSFAFHEKTEGVVIDVEVNDRCAEASRPLASTYLIESSLGRLQRDEAATITWPNPETRLIFEAEPPARVDAHEAGMGTIRLKASTEVEPTADVRTLRYRWRWCTVPGHQIWDREV